MTKTRRRRRSKWERKWSSCSRSSMSKSGTFFTIHFSSFVIMQSATKLSWWSTSSFESRKPTTKNFKRHSNSDRTRMKSSMTRINALRKYVKNSNGPLKSLKANAIFLSLINLFCKYFPIKLPLKNIYQKNREKKQKRKDWNRRLD